MPDILVPDIFDCSIPLFEKKDTNGDAFLRTTFVDEETGRLYNAVVFPPRRDVTGKAVGFGKLIIQRVAEKN